VTIHVARTAELTVETLYRILRLRMDVFVVEQACPYPDLDGRDLEPATRQLWIDRDGEVLATLRLLDDPDAAVIGRVATAATARSAGLAGQLIDQALTLVPGRDVVLHAQARLEPWYGRFGFVRTGPDFLEDGLPHLPMRRPAD
jgi:ElaA protein